MSRTDLGYCNFVPIPYILVTSSSINLGLQTCRDLKNMEENTEYLIYYINFNMATGMILYIEVHVSSLSVNIELERSYRS